MLEAVLEQVQGFVVLKILLCKENLIYKILSSRTDIEHFPSIKGLEFRNKKAKCHFDMVVSLDCRFCRKAINQVSMLLSKHPKTFFLNIILVPLSYYNDDHK
jgi:hypothetical protein